MLWLLHVLRVDEALKLAIMMHYPCDLCLINSVGTRMLAEGQGIRRLAAIWSFHH